MPADGSKLNHSQSNSRNMTVRNFYFRVYCVLLDRQRIINAVPLKLSQGVMNNDGRMEFVFLFVMLYFATNNRLDDNSYK